MTSIYVCRSCLRTVRNQSSQLLERAAISRSAAFRTFTVSASQSQAPTPTPAQLEELKRSLRNNATEKPKAKLSSARHNIAERIRKSAPETAETYHAYGTTEHFLNTINDLVGYDVPQIKTKDEVPKLEGGEDIGVANGEGEWYKELKLTPTFNAWAQLTMLHLYILTTRIRCLPSSTAKIWSQNLTDHFFLDAETRMETLHSINSRSMRSKYLKDLFLQWRGVLVSYDEGLVKGDAVLASAVWRNLFSGEDNVDPVRLAMVVAYLRREVLRCAGEGEVMAWSRFGGLKSEEPVVLMKSHFMDQPFPVSINNVGKGQAKA